MNGTDLENVRAVCNDINLLEQYRKKVYCEMELDGGGWLAFQKRFDGSVDFFNQEWYDYKEGFGDVDGEHWLGNKWLNLLTTSEKYDYLVWAKAYDGDTRMKKMLGVRVENEIEHYRITFEEEGHYFEPDVSYGTTHMDGSKFSTVLVENDVHLDNCAALYGPWWHKACFNEAMNG